MAAAADAARHSGQHKKNTRSLIKSKPKNTVVSRPKTKKNSSYTVFPTKGISSLSLTASAATSQPGSSGARTVSTSPRPCAGRAAQQEQAPAEQGGSGAQRGPLLLEEDRPRAPSRRATNNNNHKKHHHQEQHQQAGRRQAPAEHARLSSFTYADTPVLLQYL